MSKGLYRLDEFRDNCGFGLIAHLKGNASHGLLEKAIEALTCMTHRGGIAADGKTGDGCGLLMQKPDGFFRGIVKEELAVDLPELYAVGAIMLGQNEAARDAAKTVIREELARENLSVVGWRMVPTNNTCLGEIALKSQPMIEQVFIIAEDELDAAHFDARLFVARRHIEKSLAGEKSFYIASLSAGVVCYKGLMMPVDLPSFYPDLSDSRLETAICVFHQRFSTNTLPEWPLAQPFRMLAHNGEINTILGNRNWTVARTPKFDTLLLPELAELEPLVNRTGSDSSSLDNMLEVLVTGGIPLHRAVRMLIPPAWHNVEDQDPDERAFFAYQSMHMEPWDGPAGLVITDGRYAVCALDRNGLRPSRWVLTDDDIITVASEVGVYPYAPEAVVSKGRLGPGDMLSIDIVTGQIETRDEIDPRLAGAQPYRRWLREGAKAIESTMEQDGLEAEGTLSHKIIQRYMKMYGVSHEERVQVLAPLAEGAQEAIASMGDDSPVAVLSEKDRSVFDYFRQQFAQVTNPPIDPLREGIAMSLSTQLGKERNVFKETSEHAQRINLNSPVLSPRKYFSLKNNDLGGFEARKFALKYTPAETDLESAIKCLCADVEAAVRDGVTICILSDYKIDIGEIPIQAVFAVGAVHNHLIAMGLRCDANIIISTGAARDSHQIATLIGCGATAVYPYLSYHLLHEMCESGELIVDVDNAFKHYRKGIVKGLMKILSKMGISTIASYRGAMLYEAVGFADEIVDLCFPGLISRIQGSGFADFQQDQEAAASFAWKDRKPISPGGLFKYIHGQEYHSFNPDVVQALHKVVRSGDYADWRGYADLVNNRPVTTLRDLMCLKTDNSSIPLDQVESAKDIIARFDSAGMSLGALSPEAHESLAEALNSLGGRSNSGEGGEDPRRYGTNKSSKIKQVA
ncbi:MAG: glutamate synthase large subunit, partial [Porticoccaceae bacterium]|nr:glutamate synthase large subunit [Porticoccaceae bacterium]